MGYNSLLLFLLIKLLYFWPLEPPIFSATTGAQGSLCIFFEVESTTLQKALFSFIGECQLQTQI